MRKKPSPDRLSAARLEDQWHSLLLSTFLKMRAAVQNAKRKGIDQSKIADRIVMDDAQLSRILKGDVNVTLRTMHKIARAVDCRLDIELTDLTLVKKPNAASWTSSLTKAPHLNAAPSTRSPGHADISTSTSQLSGHWVGLKPVMETETNKELFQ